jgi:beta-galactosidase GanA
MEPTPGEFRTDGVMDIVKFAQMAQQQGLLIVLRVGPFICDGPDYGGFPWWLTRQNTPATMDPAAPGAQLRVRTADPAFLHRCVLSRAPPV